MKRIILLLGFIIITISIYSQYSFVAIDSFKNSTKRTDLSLKITRNGYDEPVTAFAYREVSDNKGLSYTAITLNEQAIGKCGYSFDNGDYMTHSAIDFEFPTIDRTSEDALKLEFDAIWDTQGGSGESGRAVIFFITDYPAGGPEQEAFKNMNGDPFGRPAYNIRILNGSYGAFMCYGGGTDPEGVFEIVNGSYWLPGFSSLAGGGTIGQGDNYPANAFIETPEGTPTTSTTEWKHYTWVLDYERQSLYWRNSGEGPENDELLLFMEIPEDGDINQINSAHGSFATQLPPNYNWFEAINAVRFYWRGVNNFALSNVVISKTGEPVTTFVQFAKSKIKIQESDGNADLILLIANPEMDVSTTAEISLIKGNSELIDGFEKASLVFPANESSPQALSLTITGDDNAVNDTLLFKITDVQGGNLPTTGLTDTLMLVIDDRTGTETGEKYFSKANIFPNPATDKLTIQGMEEFNGDYNYVIIDITGKERIAGNAKGNITLNVEMLENGIYFLRFLQGDSIYIKRISILK